jgi:hypothetical protein
MGSTVRDRIVEAALDRFHTLGFNGCGVQDIVDKAGIPKGSFYNYFKAKELLAVEVLKPSRPFRVLGFPLCGIRIPQKVPDRQHRRRSVGQHADRTRGPCAGTGRLDRIGRRRHS